MTMEKKELRKYIKTRKASMTAEQRKLESLNICDQVCKLSTFSKAKTVVAYYPMCDEVDVRSLFDLDETKQILLPIMDGENLLLRNYSGEENLVEGAFHVMEPSIGDFFIAYDQIDVIIVPVVAFSIDGKRCGHGKGFYDRFLAKLPNAIKIGVGFKCQLVEDLPIDSHDVKLDYIVTSTCDKPQ